MKEFNVVYRYSATSEFQVKAKSKAEAIKKVRNMLNDDIVIEGAWVLAKNWRKT